MDTTNLASIEIPAGVTFMGRSVFAGSSIESLTFAPGSQLATIGTGAFYGTNLVSIEIPASVTSIDREAFSGWTNQQRIYIHHATLTPPGWSTGWLLGSSAQVWNASVTPPVLLNP